MIEIFSRAFRDKRSTILTVLTYGIAINGIAIIATPVLATMWARHSIHFHGAAFRFDLGLILGLTLLYLSALLRRRKRTAWFVAMVVYALIFALNLSRHYLQGTDLDHMRAIISFVIDLVLPLAAVVGLAYYRNLFTVKSDIRSFAFSVRFTILVLSVTFIYGVSGFMLMDHRDFHHEINFIEAAHRTVDQFGLTTGNKLESHSRRAHAFADSLSILSLGSVTYVFISLFQPIRARLTDQGPDRERMRALLAAFPSSSEDFFKLWPHDKTYFFTESGTSALAYSVCRGMALVVGDPAGDPRTFSKLIDEFEDYCRTNDWSVVFVHTEPTHSDLYKSKGFSLQKLGEEAVLDLGEFMATTRTGKYFRHIRNRFEKQAYTTELLQPPHNDALIARLRSISDDWLSLPGRAERTFMMGNFSAEYIQLGPVMVLRDQAGTIQAFINQIPTFVPDEANFDMLRHTKDSAGNSNDYILMAFIETLHAQGFKRLNLGLCPLAGLDEPAAERSVVTSALRFAYANGDRFYSFSGLHRFKAKYKPSWSGRYIVYRGGVRSFTRAVNSLNRAMKV